MVFVHYFVVGESQLSLNPASTPFQISVRVVMLSRTVRGIVKNLVLELGSFG